MRSMFQDARLALRALIRRPGFATVAVLTLALGIGANTAIFSLVNTVLLQPLPYPVPQELVRIWSSNPEQDREQYFTSPLSYYEWIERTESFASIGAAWPREVTLTDEAGVPVRLHTLSTTVGWFDALRVTPYLGRVLQPVDEGVQWGEWRLVLTYGLWRDRFGADSSVVGTTVRIDGQPAEIIGVLQPGSEFPANADVYTNFVPPRTQSAQYMDIIARLAPGRTMEAAQTELATVATGLQEEFPRALAGWGVEMAPLFEDVVGDVRPALLTLMAVAGLVLIIACANVANLLLAQTEERQRELALRSALGADRRRLVRQLLTESVVLGTVGAAAGLGVALIGLRALIQVIPATLPRFAGVHLDLAMLGVTTLSAVVTGIAFGLAPALHIFRVDLQSELKSGTQRVSGGQRGVQLRDVFVVGQMALALVVSICAALLMQSFRNLRNTDPGFTPEGVVTFEMALPTGPYPDMANVADTYRDLLERIEAVPGVDAAGATSTLPLAEPYDYLLQLAVMGEPAPQEGEEPHAWYRQVSPGFFRAAGIQIVRGRGIEPRDRADQPGVAVINRTLARTLFGDEDPIGRRLSGVSGNFGPLGVVLNNETEIVGVVDDVRYGSLRNPAAPSLYMPLDQAPFRKMSITVRTSGDPTSLVSAIRREVASVDPNIPLSNVMTLQETVDQSLGRDRFAMLLANLFGVLALALSAVGIYGVLSYAVAKRTQELGIRIALGATDGRVLGLVMSRTAKLVGAGLAIGLLASAAATSALSSQLFGVNSRDPLTFGAVALLLAGVAVVSSYLPAWRATRLSPLTALRAE
jgi:putative ABC transport system permease protein